MKRFNPEKELNKVQYGDRNKLIGIIVFLLVIIAIGSTYALYQVRHTQKLVFNTVAEFKKRDVYLSVLVDGEYQNDFPTQEEGMLYGGYECDGSATINFDTDKWQVALYAKHPDKCTIKFGHKYVDESGANYPELYQGMIPVYFENEKIYVADVTSKWYNYDEHEWANAVLIDNTNETIKSKFYDDNGNLLGGHEVSEEDILQMYVWIPRYKYQLFNTVPKATSTEQMVNIKFENGIESTGNITCTYINNNDGTIEEKCVDRESNPVENGDWYTHPAFTFKGTFEESGTELKGIWVGKFEPSEKDKGTSGLINSKDEAIKDITILPNKISIVNRKLDLMFNATRNISSIGNIYNLSQNEVDTHIIKNIEWGAVAFLHNSIYGVYTDENTCDIKNCDMWMNNIAHGSAWNTADGTVTGCGGGVSIGALYNMNSCEIGKTWEKEGVKASTTNNIYGIYDMSGGMWDHVMGIMINTDGIPMFDGMEFDNIAEKYYDIYAYDESSRTTIERAHLGDATKEVQKIYGSYGGAGWFKDQMYAPYKGNYWLLRGGPINDGSGAGIFAQWAYNETSNPRNSFRVVLTAQDGED